MSNSIRQISFTTVINTVTVNVTANYDSANPDGHEIITAITGLGYALSNRALRKLGIYDKVHEEGSSQDWDIEQERRDQIDEDTAWDELQEVDREE